MIKSMTGYGKAVAELENGKLTVEIRSVNAKSAEISIKSSLLPKDRELELRKRIADSLVRGTIDVFLTWEADAQAPSSRINTDLARQYFSQLRELGSLEGILSTPQSDAAMLASVLKMPDVVDSGRREIINDANWNIVSSAFDEALEAINDFRATEGKALYYDVTSRIDAILKLYEEVETYEPERIAAVREKILKAAEDLKVKLDGERFEQEMIFYLEKLDINEERTRLRQHCRYFMETIDSEEAPGKKLGFIIQEMGREINTTGSKANHAGIQSCVVKMKDELEKMREQSMNIL